MGHHYEGKIAPSTRTAAETEKEKKEKFFSPSKLEIASDCITIFINKSGPVNYRPMWICRAKEPLP